MSRESRSVGSSSGLSELQLDVIEQFNESMGHLADEDPEVAEVTSIDLKQKALEYDVDLSNPKEYYSFLVGLILATKFGAQLEEEGGDAGKAPIYLLLSLAALRPRDLQE